MLRPRPFQAEQLTKDSLTLRTVEGSYTSSLDGRFLSADQTLLSILGYDNLEGLQSGVIDIGGDLYLSTEERDDILARLLEHGSLIGLETRVRRADGDIIWVLEHAELVSDDDGNPQYIKGRMLDISERMQAKRITRALLEVSRAVHDGGSLDDLYASIHDILRRHIHAEYFYIALYDKEKDCLECPYSHDITPNLFDRLEHFSDSGNRSLTGLVIRTGEAMIVRHEDQKAMSNMGEHSLLWAGAPLKVRDEIVGVLAVQYYEEPVEFSPRDLELLIAVTDHVALAIERVKWEEVLLEREAQLANILETVQTGIVIIDSETRKIVEINRYAAGLFGEEPEMILGRVCHGCMCPENRGECPILDQGATVENSERLLLNVHGEEIPVLKTVAPIVLSGREHLLESFVDLSERKAFEERLSYQAFHDYLTGLPNRLLFMDRLKQAVKRSQRSSGYSFAVLMIDLDQFKRVNDSHGHSVGDKLLVQAGERILKSVRESDTVARLGGDEFAVLLEDRLEPQDMFHIISRLLSEVEKPYLLEGVRLRISASIGVVVDSERDRFSAEEILRNADIAMYRVKESVVERFKLFDREMHKEVIRAINLESELQKAIEQDELVLHYQPIVEAHSMQLVGFEALVRWQHPKQGLINPDTFIPLAEETGLIKPLDRWVLKEAGKQLKDWRDRLPGARDLTVSVNLSGREFQQEGLEDVLLSSVMHNGLVPRDIRLEMTENVLMSNAAKYIERMGAIKAMGFQLGIDDFGTGYSSLAYLHNFPIDFLKIDRSFVSGSSQVNEAIVRLIAAMGSALGLTVVAEGVENQEQLAMLLDAGCDCLQGFMVSKPLPGKDAERFINQ